MPLRLMGYTYHFFELSRKKHPDKPLPLLLPIVIYAGRAKWQAPLGFFDMFGDQEEQARSIWLNPIPFVDIYRLKDQDIEPHPWLRLFEFVLKHRKTKNFRRVLQKAFAWMVEVEQDNGRDYAHVVIDFILNELEIDEQHVFIDEANTHLSDMLRGDIMTIAQQFILQGKQQGLQQGLEQGRNEGSYQTRIEWATALISLQTMSPEQVAQITKLSLEQVLTLSKQTALSNQDL